MVGMVHLTAKIENVMFLDVTILFFITLQVSTQRFLNLSHVMKTKILIRGLSIPVTATQNVSH